MVAPINADVAGGKKALLADLGLVATPGLRCVNFETKAGAQAFTWSTTELLNMIGANAFFGTSCSYTTACAHAERR